MKILLVCRNFFDGGGVSSRWGSLTRFLGKKHEIFVLTNVPRSVPENVLSEYNFRIFHSPINSMFSYVPFLSPVNIILVAFSVYRVLTKTKMDFVVVTIPELEEGLGSMLASKSLRNPLIVDVRDLIVEDHVEAVYAMLPKRFRKLLKFLLDKAFYGLLNSSIRVVTVTSTLKEYLVSGGTRVPVDVIPNGADTKAFRPAQPDEKMKLKSKMGFEGDLLILYAGTMGVAYYPMLVVFRAVKIITQSFPNARLLLCGSLDKSTAKMIKSLGDNVKYLGRLDQERLADLMRICDVGVITMDYRMSTFCALTTKFFEYLASGLPVVASCPKDGELDRLIINQQVGYAVSSGDYKSMAHRIIRLFKNDQERQIFAENGIRIVASKFNREKEAETYNKVFLEIRKT